MGSESSTHSNTSKSSAIKGGDWKYKLYFDPDAHSSCGEKFDNIQTKDLMDKLRVLVGTNEKIIQVWTYKVPLTTRQPPIFDRVFYHMFVVFQTNTWSWSIEKNTEGITIQRSKRECTTIQPSDEANTVVDCYRQNARNPRRQVMVKSKGVVSVYALIEWLHLRKELESEYCWICNNCMDFGVRVFKHVTNPENKESFKNRFNLYLKDTSKCDQKRSPISATAFKHIIQKLDEMKEDIEHISICTDIRLSIRALSHASDLQNVLFAVNATRSLPAGPFVTPFFAIARHIFRTALDLPVVCFVCCKTKTCRWLIESTSKTITICQDAETDHLFSYSNYDCKKENVKQVRMYDLIEWLCEDDTLKQLRILLPEHRKFCQFVFNHVKEPKAKHSRICKCVFNRVKELKAKL